MWEWKRGGGGAYLKGLVQAFCKVCDDDAGLFAGGDVRRSVL